LAAGIKQKLMRGKVSAFILCLLISGFLWLSHRLNQTYYHSIYVPVKFVNLPTNKILLNGLPEKLRLDIKTSGLKLFFVLMNEPFEGVTLDFNNMKGNNKMQAYSIGSGNVDLRSSLKFDVDVRKISPDTLYFTNKRGLSKNVPVRPVLYVNADKGFTISKPLITPAFITITGDSSAVLNVDSISTVPLYLNQVNKNYNGKLSLVRPNENVFLNLSEVNLSFQTDKILQKEVEVAVTPMNVPANMILRIFPKKVKIKYSSAAGDFDDIKESDFKAVVNYNKGRPDVKKLEVELSTLPTQAHILSVEPHEVEYLIFKTK
jgi:YbbR domain-containing protein